MVKKLLVVAFAALISAGVFADSSYKVEKVTGKVTYEVNGTWKNVTVGQELPSGTNINTALNSSLVVNNGTSSATIKAMQKGTIDKLAAAGASKGGLKKASVNSKIAGKADASKSGVSTASSRASEAKSDLEWDE